MRTRKPTSLVIFVLIALLFSALHADILTGYSNYKSLTKQLHSVEKEYPDIVKVSSLASTVKGRDIWLVSLGKQTEENKPAIAILGGLEADDAASGELCLRFIRSAAESYGHIDSVTAILDRHMYYILPRVNPDATEQLWAAVSYDRLLNANDIDLDHDGAVSEDGFDDLNGDGVISMMRITDPAGDWITDPHNPLLMRKADPAKNESGAFMLMQEGIDNDNDGFWNEDPPGGVDINKNFSFNYAPFKRGAGPHPVSEIESRAVADFLFAHWNIAAVFSFSSNENLLHPWSAAQEGQDFSRKPITAVLPNDAKLNEYISDEFKKMTHLKDAPKPVRGHGNFAEWAYYHYGRWSFAAPAWWPPKIEHSDSTLEPIKDDPLENEKRLYHWLSTTRRNGFLEWTAIDHPDFPDQKVEVGGFLPGAWKNPPADSLDVLAQKYNAFIYKLAAFLPTIEIVTQVEALGKQVYRVTATIKNNGFLPSNSELGSRSQWVRKIKAELQWQEAQQIVSGNRFYLIDGIPGGAAYKQSWLVMGKKESQMNVLVGSPSVGFVTKSVTLK